MRAMVLLAIVGLMAADAAAGASWRRAPKEYDFETLAEAVEEKGGRPETRALPLGDLERQVREAVRRRRSPDQAVPLGGLTAIHGYRWDARRHEVELIGEVGDPAVSPIYAEQFAVALRIARYPVVVQSLDPSGTEPGSPQLVLAYPKEIVDTLFLESLIKADYFLKAISMNHVAPIVRTPKTAMDEAVLRCERPARAGELQGPPDNIFFQPLHPVIEQARTADGFTLSIRDIDLELRAGRQVKNLDILTFVEQVNRNFGALIAAYPRVFRPLVNSYKLHMLAQLLQTEQEAKLDLSYWLAGFPVGAHSTPRTLPAVRSTAVARFCEGPAVEYREDVSSGQLWGGVILTGIHGLDLPGRKKVLSGIYRSKETLLTLRSDGLFESQRSAGAAVTGRFESLEDGSFTLDMGAGRQVLRVIEGGLQGEDGRLWVEQVGATRHAGTREQAIVRPELPAAALRGSRGAPPAAAGLSAEVRQLAARVDAAPGPPAVKEGASYAGRGWNAGLDEIELLREAARLREILGDTEGASEGLAGAIVLAGRPGQTWRREEIGAELRELRERSHLPAETRAQLTRALRLDHDAARLADAGAYRAAISALLEALRSRREAGGGETRGYAEALGGLSSLYLAVGDPETAAARAREGLQLAHRLVGDSHSLYARTLMALAASSQGLGMYAPAVLHFEQALDILRRQEGPKSRSYARCLAGLASLHRETEDLGRAEALYREALEVQRERVGEDDSEVAETLNGLGLIDLARAEYRQAESLLAAASEVRRKVLGAFHPETLQSLNNLATLYSETRRFDEAARLFDQVLGPIEKGRVDAGAWKAVVLNNVAILLDARGDHVAAEKAAERALALARERYGPQHPEYANLLNTLAGTYAELGKWREAKGLYLEALKALEGFPWERHSQLAVTLSNLGVLLDFEGDHAAARALFERVVLVTRSVLGDNHPLYARALGLLGGSHFQKGNRTQAEVCYRQALEILRRGGNEDSPDYGEILKMATILRLQRKRPEGIEVVDLVSELGGFR